MRETRLRCLTVVTAFLCIPPPGRALAEADAASPSDFSADERLRLERGELVSRATKERGPGDVPLIGGTSWQVIDRRPEDVWNILLDPAQYPRTLPQVTHASTVHVDGDERTVRIEHGNRFLQLGYHLTVRVDAAARRINFRVDDTRPHDIKGGTGFYLVRAYGKQKTLLIYAVLADIGDRFLGDLLRANAQEWILKVPWLIKRAAERQAAAPRQVQTTWLRASFRSWPSCRAA